MSGSSVVPTARLRSTSGELSALADGGRAVETVVAGGERRTIAGNPRLLPVDWEPDALPRSWSYIVLHHTGTEEGDVTSIDATHRQRTDAQGHRWLGIGYHFVIGNGRGMPEGIVEPTFRWKRQLHGAHAGDSLYNEQGIGVCLVGNFEENPPSAKQTEAVVQLVRALSERYGIEPSGIVRHADVRVTECPGLEFPFHEIVEAAANRSSRDVVGSTTRHPARESFSPGW